MSTRSEIEASTYYHAQHNWPDAHPNRKYLRQTHAHRFRVTAWAPVQHGDREIEFDDFQDRLIRACYQLGKLNSDEYGIVAHMGHMSCEHMGERILQLLPEAARVRVMEDEFVGATVYRKEATPEVAKTPEGFRHYPNRPKIVTLCGSTKFKDEFRAAEARLEGEGICVFTVGFFAHADKIAISKEAKEAADELHKWKILFSDYILVINPGGYVGESTRSEIVFALQNDIPVTYLEHQP